MSDEELKPCPFCGDAESLDIIHTEGTILHPHYYIECDTCGARSGGTDSGNHIAAWNTRTQASEPESFSTQVSTKDTDVPQSVVDALEDKLKAALENHHLCLIVSDDDGQYPLIDALTAEGRTIKDGKEEIAYLINMAIMPTIEQALRELRDNELGESEG